MADESNTIAAMRAITVSREYGSGGGEIAMRLAKRLAWQLIDHEVVVRVARKLRVSEQEAVEHDERVESLAIRLLKSLRVVQPTMPVAVEIPLTTDSRPFYKARCQVIEGAVATGHVVIVGRGAQAHLAERHDVFHLRVVAPLDLRIAYVMSREGLERAAARERILEKDQERCRYLQTFYQRHPNDPHLYDLVVNTGVLDLESAVDVSCLALERKARRLSTPIQDLGPASGLARYPGPPEDFRPPQRVT
ncbi:MAG: cytidylate kinase-like family protein [Chloroflexi bacterium]|nr:cytidylate kinase-like family protein [Ktedonobacteraceae bacterium]MBV9707050.1 cytidylate kinase-like family protein [Chloroflexota bacterium]